MADYINEEGNLYTIDEINQASEEYGIPFDEVLSKNGLSPNPEKGPGKKKPAANATVAGKSTVSKSAQPSSGSPSNPFGKTTIFDPLNITKNALDAARAPKKATNNVGPGTKLDSRGYPVARNIKEPTLWDNAVDFAKNLFIDKNPDENGKLSYYDQTPIKEQQLSFKKNSQEALTATGKFEFLKDYSPEDRALFVSKLVPKTSYTEKVYNQETNDYDIVPKQEAVDYITKDIDPTKFKTKAQLDNAITLNVKKLASEDSSFEFEQKLAKMKAAPLINKKIEEIKKKYSLTDAASVEKATKELQGYAATTITDLLVNSSGFQHLNQNFSNLENQATATLTKQFERSKEFGFNLVDTTKQIGKSVSKVPGLGVAGKIIEGVAEIGEGIGKGVTTMGNSATQSLVSLNQGSIKQLGDIYKSIEGKSDSQKIDKNFESTWINDELSNFDPSNQTPPATYGEAKSRLKSYLDKTKSLIGERVQKIADTKEYLGLFNEADLKDGIGLRDITRLVGEQVPNLAITTAGTVSGNPLLIGLGAASMFSQTYGAQYYDTIETGLKEELGRIPNKEEIAEAIGAGKYANRAEAAASAAISAGLEFASELNIIKNTGKALGFGTDANTVLGSLFRGEVKNFGKSMLNQAGNISKSGIGEYLTESLQTAIDQTSKGLQLHNDASRYVDLKEINESGKVGGLIGAVFPFVGTVKTQTAIELRAAATQVASTFDLSGKNMSNLVQVDNFFKAASNNIEERFKVGDINSEQKRAELETLGTIRSSGAKIPSEFNPKAKEKALGLMLEKANIERSIEGKDKDLVTPEIERLKTISTNLAAIAFSEKERIRTESNLESLDKSIETVKNIVDKEGNKVYKNPIGSGKSIEIFETTEDAQDAYDNWASQNNEKSQDIKLVDGFVLPNGQILINKQRAAEIGALNVAPHELLHNILKSEFSNSSKKVELKDKFLNILSKSERTKLDERMAAYTAEEIENAPDEYITQYFELLKNGDIKWSDNVKETLVGLWNNVLKPIFVKQGFKNIEFEDGRDIYNFVKDYAKTIKKGKVSERAQGLLKAGENISGVTKMSRTQSDIFKQELADLEEEYDEGYGDMLEEEYLPKKQSIENKIKTALKKEAETKTEQPISKKETLTEEDEVKEIIRENKASVASDKVQNIYDSKGKEGAQDIINLFKPITKKIVDKRRDAPDFDRELLTDEIETGVGGILDLITKYNPKSGVPLAAYINKYLPVRAIATSKRLLGKEFSKDVTEEKGLMAEETVSETKEKPKYDNALESKVFEPEALEAINKKILSVIRTLKSKIDAPVSINRTVTPLIAEIKDEIGKQVDINVKTVMGGKKDNQLKKWLLKNKKYILENMTTTWLMGKGKANKVEGGIPNAIQKSIDGRWVSYPEWVGKTIDRESVSTDQAGRTSGAELVRRLPNVANNVSNEDFLSHILEPSGNPIRGRKESLAKAIAEEASFDIVLDDFENQGPLFEAFAANQERLGVEIDDVLTTAFANQVERGNIKFSKSAVSNSMLFLLKENNWDFNSKELIDFKNSLNDKDQRYYAEFRKKWIRRVGNLLDEYKRIWESNAGVKFEAEAYNKLRKFSKNNTDFILNETVPDKFNSRNPDLVYKVGKDGRDVIVELKADKTAPHGSTSNSNLLGDEIVFTKGFEGDAEMKSKMENNESRKKALEYLKNNNLSKDGNSLIVSTDVWDNVKGEKTGPSMVITPKTLAQINVGKDIIHIQGNGSFTYEGHNTGELIDVPLIDGNMYVYSRITSVASGKNRRIVERLFFQLGNNWNQKSDYNLIDNPEKFVNQSIKFSKTISPAFNKIIEENKGVQDYKNFSDIVARRRGAGKNRFDIYVPASAADFELLLYNFIGKGTKGEEQKKFFTDTLLKPYANGNDLMDAARQSIKNEYKQLLTEFPDVAKKIEKRTPDGDFTYDQAIRVAMWNDEGVEIPGLSQRDTNKLTELVNNDPELKAFKEGLIVTGRQGRGWVKPEEYWDANTIITDLHNLTEGEGRKKFLSEFIANAEEMFGKWENGKLVGPNINKVEAVYGTDVREALEDVLYRMTTGKNRGYGNDKETSNWAKWVTGSTGAIMFLNVRSAALQLIGAVNFLNLRDNNPYAAAKAFANQKQYWEDFATIWNSDKMRERRGGLKEDVAAAEIANAAAGSKNKVGAVLSYLLKVGYTPTQMADSFAIASGGAPFYRNRINSYKSEYDGLDKDGNLKRKYTDGEAEEAAWDDFTKVSDETQQSGDPRDISKQQASAAGRLLLTFQNTAMQQSRIVKKAFLDIKNRRGDDKTNFAKIAYYIAIQNTMFAVLQQGLFAVAFGDDDEDEEKPEKEKKLNEKLFDVADGVVDTILRGTGFAGGIVATVKNMAKKYLDERDKKFKADYAKVVLEGANLSPPIGSKLRKLYSGLQQTKFDKDLIEKRGWDVMQDGRVKLSPSYGVTGKIVEAFTNVPMDRLVTKVNNASEALNSQNTTMQRIMVGLGWSPYSAGIEDSAGDKKIREEAKAKRKIEGVEKAKETRERTKDSIKALPLRERIKLKRQAVLDRREKRKRRKMG